MEKKIIGFSGRKRCGKTSLSYFMKTEHNAEIITVAQALKELCCELLGYTSVTDLNIDKDNNKIIFIDNVNPTDQHNRWVNIIQKTIDTDKLEDIKIIEKVVNVLLDPTSETTVRDVLQIVGTNIIRKINPEWHTKKLRENILNSKSQLIVVDDIRYPNEKQVIDDLGGVTFFVMRPELPLDISNHSSENSLVWQNFPDDKIIVNYMSLQELCDYFNEYFKNDFHFAINIPILKHGMHDFQNDEVNNFGYNLSEEELVDFRKCIIANCLKYNGCIVLHGNDKKKYKKYLTNHPLRGYTTLCIWNPFIIENIKLYL